MYKFENLFRKMFGMKYWSLYDYLKNKDKNDVKFIGDFDKLSIKEDVDSIMIGHIHQPKIDTTDLYRTYHGLYNQSFLNFELN